MCEANAYLVKDDKEQLLMESVDIIEPEDDKTWKLIGIFGDQKMVRGKIKGMKLVEHKILFEEQVD